MDKILFTVTYLLSIILLNIRDAPIMISDIGPLLTHIAGSGIGDKGANLISSLTLVLHSALAVHL